MDDIRNETKKMRMDIKKSMKDFEHNFTINFALMIFAFTIITSAIILRNL